VVLYIGEITVFAAAPASAPDANSFALFLSRLCY
jgi:hypothetical protein